jgi:hypothetical protein
VGLDAIFDTSALPHPEPGGALHGTFEWRALLLELEVGALAPSQKVDAKGRGGTFALLYAAPHVCAASALGVSRIALCAAYELGRLRAEGDGVERPYSRNTFWHAARADVRVAWPLAGRLWLAARVGAALPLARHTFVLDQSEAVYRPPWLSLRASVGVELEL